MIAAIELALKHKGDLAVLASLDGAQLQEGASIGAVWIAAAIARRLGLDQASALAFPANWHYGKSSRASWIKARVSSAVRLAQVHAACDVLGIRRGFDENGLYENLTWLCQHQEQIERLAQSRLGAGTGGAAPVGDSRSHAPVAAVTAKSPCTNSYLDPGSACPEGVNIRWSETFHEN